MSDTTRRTRARRARNLWLASGAYGVAFVGLYVGAVLTSFGQLIDAGSLSLFGWLRSDAWMAFYDGRDLVTYGVLAGAAVAVLSSVLEHRWTPAVYSAVLVGVVSVVAFVMKELAARPDLGEFAYAHNTFPSGHTAVSLAAAVAVVWCGPRWVSPVLVLVLGGLVSYVALGSVFSMAHRGSDSVGGVLLAGVVSCALAALSRATEPVSSRLRRASIIAGAVLVGLGAAAVGGVLLAADDHAVQLGFAIVLCTLGLIVSVLAVHRPFSAPTTAIHPRSQTTGHRERL